MSGSARSGRAQRKPRKYNTSIKDVVGQIEDLVNTKKNSALEQEKLDYIRDKKLCQINDRIIALRRTLMTEESEDNVEDMNRELEQWKRKRQKIEQLTRGEEDSE